MANCELWQTFIILLTIFPSGHLFSHRKDRSQLFESTSSEQSSSEESSTFIEAKVIERHVNPPHEDEALREILCPEQGAGASFIRYDLRAGKCAQIETQAHCGKNMIFKEELDSSAYGFCECDFENHSVPLVFHLPSFSCHPIYQQAFCKPNEWLVFSQKAKGPVCERNKCAQQTVQKPKESGRRSKLIFPDIWENTNKRNLGENNQNLVPLNGSGPCVPLGSQTQYCDPNEKVLISTDDIFPRCGVPGKSVRRLSIVPNACPPGSYYSIIGYCQPSWDF